MSEIKSTSKVSMSMGTIASIVGPIIAAICTVAATGYAKLNQQAVINALQEQINSTSREKLENHQKVLDALKEQTARLQMIIEWHLKDTASSETKSNNTNVVNLPRSGWSKTMAEMLKPTNN